MSLIEAVKLDNVLQLRNGFVGLASGAADSLRNVGSGDFFRANFHHTAGTVDKQQKILVVFFVDDHVQRPVAITKFCDGRTLGFLTGLQTIQWKTNQRRADIGRQQIRLAVDVERNKRPNRGIVFPFPMRTMVNLDARTRVGLHEWKRNLVDR